MKIELCNQGYEDESCFIHFDGGTWFLTQGSDRGGGYDGEGEVSISAEVASHIAEFLRRVVWYDSVDSDRFKGRCRIEGRVLPGGDYPNLFGSGEITAELTDDPSEECWARVRIRDVSEEFTGEVHFDADEAWVWLAAIEASETWRVRASLALTRPKKRSNV